jgi:hypothetical protein
MIERIRILLGIVLVAALMTALTGCSGYIGEGYGGGGYGGYGDGGYYRDYDDGGDVYLFGGNYDRGRDVRAYSQRGASSFGAAHISGGGHVGGAHAGGGGGGHGGGGGGGHR